MCPIPYSGVKTPQIAGNSNICSMTRSLTNSSVWHNNNKNNDNNNNFIAIHMVHEDNSSLLLGNI